MSLIPREKYNEIIEVLPILCVDIFIQNSRGEYLLIKRANEPMKGRWWPIGGRVHKGETLEEAAIRKIIEETALQVKAVRPIGYFELITDETPFGLPFPYHAVGVVFSAFVDDHEPVKLDAQSTEWKYAKEIPADYHINPFTELYQPNVSYSEKIK